MTWIKRTQGDLLLAHGRDPYFSGWLDTLQLNYGNPRITASDDLGVGKDYTWIYAVALPRVQAAKNGVKP